MLDELVAEVSLSRYRAFTERRREEGEIARNPLLEIFQLARTDLEGNDNYGALRAVVALERATENLLGELSELPAAEQRATDDAVHRLFDYWVQLAGPTVERGADDVVHALVDGLQSAAAVAVTDAAPAVASRAAVAMASVCEQAHDAGRLESRYVEAFEVFAGADGPVVETAAESLVVLAGRGADGDAVAAVLATLVDAGHRDAVTAALEGSETAGSLRAAVDERVAGTGEVASE